MFRPLEGVQVLDLSRVLAGPYTAKLLSDLGATVLRVEAPWGDDTRGWGPPFTEIEDEQVAAYWTSVNLGKSIIRKNLKIESDLQDVRKLISDSDIIIENLRPGKAEEWFDLCLIGQLFAVSVPMEMRVQDLEKEVMTSLCRRAVD